MFTFKNPFMKGDGQFHNDTVYEMLRLASECEEEGAKEVLSLLLMAHEDGSYLTIADIKTRDIYCSTDTGGSLINSIVYSIHSLERKCYFLLGQKSSVIFRKGIGLIRVIPLVVGRSADYALIIEQPTQSKALSRAYYDALALCVSCEVNKKRIRDASVTDESGCKNRNELYKAAKERLKNPQGKVLVLSVSEDALLRSNELGNISVYHGKLAELIKEKTESFYSLSMGNFAILATGNEAEVIADANALIDNCMDIGITVRCGISNLESDEYLSVYLAEKSARTALEGQVIFVKDRDSVYTREDIYNTFRDTSIKGIEGEPESVSFTPYEERKKDSPNLSYEFSSETEEEEVNEE